MDLGTAVHTLLLENHLFDEQYKFYDKIDGRTKEGKAQAAEIAEMSAKGIVYLPESDREMFTLIKKNFDANPEAVYYSQGDVELSHYIEDFMGVYLRVRPDVINREKNFLFDEKTCRDNSPRGFKNDCYKHGYHIQAAIYGDSLGIPVENFVFGATETVWPYTTQCYVLNEDMIDQGRFLYKDAIRQWKQYQETGIASLYDGYEKNTNGLIIL